MSILGQGGRVSAMTGRDVSGGERIDLYLHTLYMLRGARGGGGGAGAWW